MLHAVPGVTVMPRASQGQCHVECGHRRLHPVVSAPAVPSGCSCLAAPDGTSGALPSTDLTPSTGRRAARPTLRRAARPRR
ncbi:hypothetical protein IW256_002458 [Actinomadura viridis]|uniref:Uncharacterized protein n=1 Tax=Actinomadura viridis TaxID=58110 RepID=A0A931DDZ2_9ACTN|nr:hypothetical protein [Actinomadura viridis]